jgi:hypothetical protein
VEAGAILEHFASQNLCQSFSMVVLSCKKPKCSLCECESSLVIESCFEAVTLYAGSGINQASVGRIG